MMSDDDEETVLERAMTDVDTVAERIFAHHARGQDFSPDLREHDERTQAYWCEYAVEAMEAIGLTEEWRTTGWLGPVSESLARSQAESEGTLQRRLVGKWMPAI